MGATTLFDERHSSLVRLKKVNLGGRRDYSEERYTIDLLPGTTYKDVEFILTRRNGTRILLNRVLKKKLIERKYVIQQNLNYINVILKDKEAKTMTLPNNQET